MAKAFRAWLRMLPRLRLVCVCVLLCAHRYSLAASSPAAKKRMEEHLGVATLLGAACTEGGCEMARGRSGVGGRGLVGAGVEALTTCLTWLLCAFPAPGQQADMK